MQTVTLNLYTIDELDDKAKEAAREWWRSTGELFWCEEAKDSITTFCERFGVTLKEWSVGPYAPYHFATDAEQRHFRGVKLSDFTRDHMPTGYCVDCALWQTFYDEFKRTGDAKAAFVEALHEGFKDWRNDMEGQLEDDYIDEHLSANLYQFTADGRFYR